MKVIEFIIKLLAFFGFSIMFFGAVYLGGLLLNVCVNHIVETIVVTCVVAFIYVYHVTKEIWQ